MYQGPTAGLSGGAAAPLGLAGVGYHLAACRPGQQHRLGRLAAGRSRGLAAGAGSAKAPPGAAAGRRGDPAG